MAGCNISRPWLIQLDMVWYWTLPPCCSALRATSRYVPSLSGIALITATMFSAVNSPTPRVLFGMVVSGRGVRLLRVGGCVQGGAVELSCLLGPWCAKRVSVTCSGGLFGLLCRPFRAAKRAARMSRPSWVVFALPSVSGGSGTVEGLNFCRR